MSVEAGFCHQHPDSRIHTLGSYWNAPQSHTGARRCILYEPCTRKRALCIARIQYRTDYDEAKGGGRTADMGTSGKGIAPLNSKRGNRCVEDRVTSCWAVYYSVLWLAIAPQILRTAERGKKRPIKRLTRPVKTHTRQPRRLKSWHGRRQKSSRRQVEKPTMAGKTLNIAIPIRTPSMRESEDGSPGGLRRRLKQLTIVLV